MCPVISSPVIREMRLANSCATNRHAIRPPSSIWRLAVLASVLVCACESAGPSVPPAAVSSDRRTAEPFPTAPVPTTPLRPIAVAPPSPTPCSRPAPSLVPALVYQNGNLDLNVPYRLGLVRFNLWPCRDIEVVRTKYGLGPAARVISEPPDPNSDPDDIRSRYYAASVPVGQEAAFVTRLVGHPEDFQYVEFAFIPTGGVPEMPFVLQLDGRAQGRAGWNVVQAAHLLLTRRDLGHQDVRGSEWTTNRHPRHRPSRSNRARWMGR